MPVSLRIPSAAAYPALTAVWERSVRATHTFLTETDIAAFRTLVLTEALPGCPLIAACRTGSANTGSTNTGSTRQEAPDWVGFAGVSAGKLEMLFVDPACHGQRIGRRLLEHAITVMGARTLDVNEDNPQAVAFYRHMGFHITGRSDLDGSGKPFPLLHMALTPA